jgi:MYXO-CTERM domain-containing protein
MFRYIAPIAVGAAVLVTPLRDALACQCSTDAPAVDVEAARGASFIFEARVATQGPMAGHSVPSAGRRPVPAAHRWLDLADVKAHRGAAPGTALTLTNGDACAPVILENGQRYLFYLYDTASLHINACGRAVAFPGAQEEIAALSGPSGSPGERPQPAPVVSAAPTTGGAPSLPPQSGSCASCRVGPAESRPPSQGLWVLALAAALAVRRSRR